MGNYKTQTPKENGKKGTRERGEKKISTYHLSDLPGPAVFFYAEVVRQPAFASVLIVWKTLTQKLTKPEYPTLHEL